MQEGFPEYNVEVLATRKREGDSITSWMGNYGQEITWEL